MEPGSSRLGLPFSKRSEVTEGILSRELGTDGRNGNVLFELMIEIIADGRNRMEFLPPVGKLIYYSSAVKREG
jgi:hypothetical protein